VTDACTGAGAWIRRPAGSMAGRARGWLRAPRPGDTGARILTVGDWLAHWLVSRTATAPSTARGYTAHVRLYLTPYLGEVIQAGCLVPGTQRRRRRQARRSHRQGHARARRNLGQPPLARRSRAHAVRQIGHPAPGTANGCDRGTRVIASPGSCEPANLSQPVRKGS